MAASSGGGDSVRRDFETFVIWLRESVGETWMEDAANAAPAAPASDPREASGRPAPAAGGTARGPVGAALPEQTLLPGEARPGPDPLPAAAYRPPRREPDGIDFRDGEEVIRGPCSRDVRAGRLSALSSEVAACTRCVLHRERTLTVFGTGDPCARLCLVGEGPGAEEDRRGEPFVGRAGQLLDRILLAMKLERSAVYICNTVKCRPPGNRTPLPEEIRACSGYLRGQIEAVSPQVILALGRPAANALLGVNAPLKDLRDRFHRHRDVPLMVTYHPAYLLRNPDAKRVTWEDVRQVMAWLGAHPDPLGSP
jgi:DNA polymerase